jgi:hypothetical protein
MMLRRRQTDHPATYAGPNGPLCGLEQVLAVGVAMPHPQRHRDTHHGRHENEQQRAWHTGHQERDREERRAERHRDAVTSRHGRVSMRHSVYKRPKDMATTASARPALTHGELAPFQRPSRPRVRRSLTTSRSPTSGAM